MSSEKPKSFMASFAAGSLSGMCSTLLFQPLDLVKTRLQVKKRGTHLSTQPLGTPPVHGSSSFGWRTLQRPEPGTIRVLIDVARKENVGALWKGLTPSLTRTIPGVGLYFGTLHAIRQAALSGDHEPSPTSAAAFAAIARSITCATLLPFTVVKTRFESGKYAYRSVFHALKSMHKREGIRGLYSGMLATLLRDVPSSSLYYMFYTASKTYTKTLVSDENLRAAHFGCAIYSAILACILTHPADVVKTRLQIDKSHSKGTLRMARKMLQDEGSHIFFSGAQARIARRSCVISLSWTVYENVIDFLSRMF